MSQITPPSSNDAVLKTLLDEREIRSVLLRYATALDQKDWSLLATCFVQDASAHYESIGLLDGYEAIEDVCRNALKNMTVTQHLIGNIDISVDEDTARSTCYLHAQHVRPDALGGIAISLPGNTKMS